MISSALTSSAAQVGTDSAMAAHRLLTRIFPCLRETNSFAQQFPGYGEQLDIAGAFIDAPDFGVPVEFLHRIIFRNAYTAVDLNGLGSSFLGDLGTVVLRHRG